MRELASLLFVAGLALLLVALTGAFELGTGPMRIGQAIQATAVDQVGTANIVTAVVLGYRGIDTLGELSILFAAATAGGFVLGRHRAGGAGKEAGFVLRTGADLLFPLLIVVGLYIVIHGHLTPGGGFQGGAILAAAFFVPILANPASPLNHTVAMVVEGFAGAAFILIGLVSLSWGEAFLTPFLGKGTLTALASAGSLPLLYLAIGLKVGSELAGLIARVAGTGAVR